MGKRIESGTALLDMESGHLAHMRVPELLDVSGNLRHGRASPCTEKNLAKETMAQDADVPPIGCLME